MSKAGRKKKRRCQTHKTLDQQPRVQIAGYACDPLHLQNFRDLDHASQFRDFFCFESVRADLGDVIELGAGGHEGVGLNRPARLLQLLLQVHQRCDRRHKLRVFLVLPRQQKDLVAGWPHAATRKDPCAERAYPLLTLQGFDFLASILDLLLELCYRRHCAKGARVMVMRCFVADMTSVLVLIRTLSTADFVGRYQSPVKQSLVTVGDSNNYCQ